jgi:signal transduction histidine kinase
MDSVARQPRTPAARASAAPSRRTWRATTATRVFGLALAVGQTMATDTLARSLPGLVALVLLAAAGSVLELEVGRPTHTAWVPVAEAILAATLLAGVLPGSALFAYLAVPAVIAGITHGWVMAVNATLTGFLGFYATSATTRDLRLVPEDLGTAGLWLAVGLGAGLLAGWQTRSLRGVEGRQAPYAAAYQLVVQLSELTHTKDVGLDSTAAARELGAQIAETTSATRWGIYVGSADRPAETLATHDPLPDFTQLAGQVRARRRGSWRGGTAVLPLRVGEHRFGDVVLVRDLAWTRSDMASAQSVADKLAVRLETALLFDQVRDVATSDERHRLARDIHDGVAQEMVALGYLVDEIEDTSADDETLRAAATLRQEISRVVGELRMSIYDLRHEVDQQHLSGALAEYVREVGAGTGLRVHLVLDEQGPPLPCHTESELLRITQEAIGNVRKHACAQNLWVTFTTDGQHVHLEVADDGVGSATPRQRHYGLHTMRERAERLDADLVVHERPGGGTVVGLTTRAGNLSPTTSRAEVTA